MTKDEGKRPSFVGQSVEEIRREAMDFANVSLYRYRPDGTLHSYDRAALKLLDLDDEVQDPDELVGRNLSSLYEPITPANQLRDQVQEHGQVRGFENHYRTLTGHERWVSQDAYLVEDPQSGDSLIQVFCQDITALKKTEIALASSEARYRALVEQSLQGILVTRLTPRPEIAFANRQFADFLGVEVDDLVGESPRELVELAHPDDRGMLVQRLAARLGGQEEDTTADFRIRRRSGETLWLTALSTHTDFDGAPAIQTTFINVTERREAENRRHELETRMRHAQKLESLGVLAGGIAHDFNNILAAILGHAELAAVKIPSGGGAEVHINEIGRAAERAAELCRHMMVYAGKGTGSTSKVDLVDVILETSRLLKVSIPKKVTLTVETSEEPLVVRGDASQLRQVVLNLISNAAEAIGDDEGAIRLSVDARYCDRECLAATDFGHELRPGRYAVIEVRDSGSGMSPAMKERLFEPFFSTKAAGRGLGLSTVLGIVRTHSGTLLVSSREGRGTTFEIYLPLSERSSEINHERDASSVARSLSGTALLVDDEPAVRDAASQMLDRLGFHTVLVAGDGVEAVKVFLARRNDIDVVVLDLSMPKLDGREVFEAIRRAGSAVPVVFSSAYEADRVRDLLKGRSATFIQKPYRLPKLRDALSAVLSGRGSSSPVR